MPRYCYTTEDGDTYEQVFAIGKAPPTIKINGEDARRDLAAEHIGVPARKGWPIKCVASGVHPDDGKKLEQQLADAGVPTEVVDGDPVYRDARHRRKALKARGFVDRTGYD